MALPVITTPKYELTLPSTKKKYKYRPFLAKEEKILLMAMEGGDEKEIVEAIKNIIRSCVDGIDADNLALFDLEYVFLKLREKSIGDVITFYTQHKNGINSRGEECDGKGEVKVNLGDVKVVFDKDHTNKIQLDDKIGVVMKYPTVELAGSMDKDSSDSDLVFDMIKNSMDFIYDAENVYNISDHSDEEVDQFIDSLSHHQLEKIQNFFATMPKVKHTVNWKCEKCGVEEEIVIEGLSNFFT